MRLNSSRMVPLFGNFAPGASLALDFVNGRYRVGAGRYAVSDFSRLPGLTVSRASVGYAERNDGTLVLFPANVARVTNKGLLVEEARTKKNTNANLNPQSLTNVSKFGDAAAVLTLVDDSAALASIGLSGNVFKLDNSAGTGSAWVILGGQVGNLNAHIGSAYIRGGSGIMSLNGPELSQTFSAAAAYRRVATLSGAPTVNTRQMQITADAGQTLFFILTVLEEGAFLTSPIPDASGTAATRPADSVSIGGLSPGGNLTAIARVTRGVATGTSRYVFQHGLNLPGGFVDGSAGTFAGTIPGVANGNVQSGVTGTVKVGAAFVAGTTITAAVAGTAGSPASVTWTPGAGTTLYVGQTSTGTGQYNDYIGSLLFYGRAYSASELAGATQ